MRFIIVKPSPSSMRAQVPGSGVSTATNPPVDGLSSEQPAEGHAPMRLLPSGWVKKSKDARLAGPLPGAGSAEANHIGGPV